MWCLFTRSFAHQPISLANAFEKPVQADHKGGFREPSIHALNSHWEKLRKGYGLNDRSAEFALDAVKLPEDVIPKSSLPELENWLKTNGQG